MASDQPYKLPRIFEVKDPAANQHVVMVLMKPNVAGHYPSKPWGTAITEIGLAKKDADLFPDYVLVDFEKAPDSDDLFWIFQKLSGPEWETRTRSREGLTPAKYQGHILQTKVKQDVAPDTTPTPLTGDLILSVVEQKEDTGLAVKVEVSEVIDPAAVPLDGGETSQWGVLRTHEKVVEEGAAVAHAAGVAQASVRPFGNGKAEESITLYPEPHPGTGVIATITDQDQDPENSIVTDILKILITNAGYAAYAATLRAAGWFVERKGQDQNHAVLVASKVDMTTLPPSESFWDTDTVRLPDTLQSITVLWGDESGGGNGVSTDEDGGSARASAAASTSPSIEIAVKAGFSGRTKAYITRTYHNGPPTDVIEPYNIIPVMGSATVFSSSRNFSCSVSKSEGGSSIGTSTQVGTSGRMIQFGPFLSNGVSPTGDGVHEVDSGVYTASAGGDAYAEASALASGNVSITLPTSTPPSIAPGAVVSRYQKVQKWRLGVWIKETVTVYAPEDS